MKKFIYMSTFLFFYFFLRISAAGCWEGRLFVVNTQLRLVFNIQQQASDLKAALHSSNQGA